MPSITEVSQGATPTLQFSLPTSIDLTDSNIYFSIEQFNRTILEKSSVDSEDITSDGNTVSVYLSQIETLQLSDGEAKAQINITKDKGYIRLPTYEAPLTILHNEIRRVLE